MAGFYFVPGTWGGLALRVAQCVFAVASGYTMLTARKAGTYTSTFSVLVSMMPLQTMWSFLQACFHVHCVWAKKELRQPITTLLMALGDAGLDLSLLGIAAWGLAMGYLPSIRQQGYCPANKSREMRANDQLKNELAWSASDQLMALLSFAAACASAYVTLLFVRDTGLCSAAFPELTCGRYQLAVSLAFVSWLLQATTAFALFFLLVKVATGAQHAD